MRKSEVHKEVKELFRVISDPPGWLQKYGIMAVTIFFISILSIASVVRFPDDVEAPVVLIAENPAIRVYTSSRGELAKLLVSPGDSVVQGQRLGIIKNPAAYEDVQRLDEILQNTGDDPQAYLKTADESFRLGTIQNNYSLFISRANELVDFRLLDDYPERISLLKKQIEELKALEKSQAAQKEIQSKQTEIAQNNYNRNLQLFEEKVVSEALVEQVERDLLNQKSRLSGLESNLIRTRISNSQLSNQLVLLETEYQKRANELQTAYKQAKDLVASAVEQWKELNYITAPITGNVLFTNLNSENEFVRENIEVMAIVPKKNMGNITGRLNLPDLRLGKIEVGMPCLVQLESYPFYEFGGVWGKVKSIASVPNEQGYRVDIAFPDGLVTTYDQPIEFKHEMKGLASIVTEDRSILSRIFDRFRSLIKNRPEKSV